MRRRDFLLSTPAMAINMVVPELAIAGRDSANALNELDDYMVDLMQQHHIPGAAAIIVNQTEILWSGAWGWSDLKNQIPMGVDRIQNIGSISKTVVASSIMQLEEIGLLDIDADINEYLDFSIRNPDHPDIPITARQLMIHTSSLRDGSAYVDAYACGDPRLSLRAWVRAFFTPDGAFYNASENFESWAPGEGWRYANLPFGILGLLVETVSGIPFDIYCKRNIFAPLGMRSTSWMISDLDESLFSVPYSWVEDGVVRGASWGGVTLGRITPEGPTRDVPHPNGLQPNCFYNHANYPDGFLRTTVSDLSRYLRAHLNGGQFQGARILRADSVSRMYEPQDLPDDDNGERTFGLTWYALGQSESQTLWGHGGGDPGVGTGIVSLREDGLGIIFFLNTGMTGSPQPILERLVTTAKSIRKQ